MAWRYEDESAGRYGLGVTAVTKGIPDPYRKLRPAPPTSDRDHCSCVGDPPIMLQAHLSTNPLSCMICNLEVRPERVGFGEDLAEKLATWRSFHDCFYLLWLDSGEFEAFAKAQLENPESAVNVRALQLVSELNAHRRTYYWWFQDTEVQEYRRLSQCPVCEQDLRQQHGRHVCESCSVVVPSERSV